MSEYGSGARSSSAQRVEVVRLRETGMSIRKIATEVFGDVAYRGRVKRILKSEAARGQARRVMEPTLDGVDLAGLDSLSLLELWFERRMAWLAETGTVPSFSQMRVLLDVERRLDAARMVEQMNDHRKNEAPRRFFGSAEPRNSEQP